MCGESAKNSQKWSKKWQKWKKGKMVKIGRQWPKLGKTALIVQHSQNWQQMAKIGQKYSQLSNSSAWGL